MDHEKFRNYLGGVQSLVIALAILVGGIWTLFTFDALQQAELATADLEKRLKDIQERRVLILDMEPSQVSIPGDSSRYISAKVTFQNIGNDTELLNWPMNPFTVSRASINKNGVLEMKTMPGVRLESFPGMEAGLRLMPGVSVHRVFLARVDEPGLYFLEVNVAASPDEQNLAKSEGLYAVSWNEVSLIAVE